MSSPVFFRQLSAFTKNCVRLPEPSRHGSADFHFLHGTPASSRILPLCPVVLSLALFGGVLFGDRAFVFRDIAHFYSPLDAWIDRCFAEGRFPEENPYENLSQPLSASGTAAVFYPLKWMRLLVPEPLKSCRPRADATYLLLHLAIAVFTLYRLARYSRTSRAAALFGGIAYAFGGSVLYQYTNPPFLVGAAWFPEALLRIHRLLDRPARFRDGVLGALVVALMILGGDPQAVYHLALVALPLPIFTLFRRRRSPAAGWKHLVLVPLLFLAALCLAAVQVLPSFEFARLSERVLVPEAHRQAVFHYSLAPIRLLEYVFPNVGGTQFPVHARWFHYFDVQIWSPSLYLGLFPVLSALLTVRFWGKDRRLVYWSWLALFAILAGLGENGGIYALLTHLPGYGAFRFPAKWMTVVSLPLCLLGAVGFDRFFREPRFRRRFSFASLVLLVLTGSAAFGARFLPFDQVPACPLFGPFDRDLAVFHYLFALGHTSCLLVVALLGIIFARYRPVRILARPFFLILLCLDLYLANAWMIATAPKVALDASPPQELVCEAAERHRSRPDTPLRVYRCPLWYPRSFANVSSKNRLLEAARWDRMTLWPKYNLLWKTHLLDVRGTMMSAEYFRRTSAIRRSFFEKRDDFEEQLAALGAEWIIAPAWRTLDATKAERITALDGFAEDTAFWKLTIEVKPVGGAMRNPFSRMPFYERFGMLISISTLLILLIAVHRGKTI